jgi:hypothetical protein
MHDLYGVDVPHTKQLLHTSRRRDEMKTIKEILPRGSKEGKYGLMYQYTYTFEDGSKLAAQHKQENPFNVGDSVDVEKKGSTQYGDYGTVSKPKPQFGKGGNNASFALSYAKDLIVPSAGNRPPETIIEDTIKIADEFLNWLNNK